MSSARSVWQIDPYVCQQFEYASFPIGNDRGICALCYIGNCFGEVRLSSAGFNLLGGTSDLGRCAFCYIYIYTHTHI